MMAEMGCNMNMRTPGMNENTMYQCGGRTGNRMGMVPPMGRRNWMGMQNPPEMQCPSGAPGLSGQRGEMMIQNPSMEQDQAPRQSSMGCADGAMPCAGMGGMPAAFGAGFAGNPSMHMSRQALMKQINEASFAMDDVLLFLDTHPDNAEAMRYYQNAAAMRKSAMDAYQRQYGPLLVDDVKGSTWSWVTEKWPWEGGC